MKRRVLKKQNARQWRRGRILAKRMLGRHDCPPYMLHHRSRNLLSRLLALFDAVALREALQEYRQRKLLALDDSPQ